MPARIRFDGDSLSTRYGDESSEAYPERVRAMLGDAWTDFAITAVPGQRGDEMLSRARSHETVPRTDGSAVVVVLVGANDLAQMAYAHIDGAPTSLSRDGIVGAMVAYAEISRRNGWRPLWCTVPGLRNPGIGDAKMEELERERQWLNGWLVAHARERLGIMDLVRLDLDPRIGSFETTFDEKLRSDGVHFTDAGRRIVAGRVVKALSRWPRPG